ncbi:MAG: DUF5689 domain-containing protein [Bacteroidota bacterium]
MKAISVMRKIWLLLLIAPAIFMAGCAKNFDVPPIQVPKFVLPDGASIISIKSLNARHTALGALDSINDDVYVTGIVVSSDASGNIYKSLYIQDTSGGLLISLDATSLYNTYHLGQRIYVKCKGLFMGDYGGMTQIGSVYNGAIGRIPAPLINQYLLLDSLPGAVPAAKLVTISTLGPNDLGTLVKLENVHFMDVGIPFSDPSASSNRNISDGANTLVMRNSNYATFAATLIPDGTGTIYGILGTFGGTLQLYIRDLYDVVGFDYSAALILNEPFTASQGTFTSYSVSGAQTWTFSATYGMTMSGFSGGVNNANEDWLISPAMDLTNFNGVNLSFNHTINKGVVSNMPIYHTLWASKNYTSGDPTLATWEQVTIPVYPAGTNWTFVNSGNVVLPASYNGISNVHFAFKYLSTASESANWEIKNVLVKGTHI